MNFAISTLTRSLWTVRAFHRAGAGAATTTAAAWQRQSCDASASNHEQNRATADVETVLKNAEVLAAATEPALATLQKGNKNHIHGGCNAVARRR